MIVRAATTGSPSEAGPDMPIAETVWVRARMLDLDARRARPAARSGRARHARAGRDRRRPHRARATISGPRRRRSDYRHRPALSSTAAEKQAAGSLRRKSLAPFGLGVLVVIASLGVIALIADRAGRTVVTDAVRRRGGPDRRAALVDRPDPEGRDPARHRPAQAAASRRSRTATTTCACDRVGASEFSELAEGFNRMATIVSHQRDRLKLLADTDALTELANHRALPRAAARRASEGPGVRTARSPSSRSTSTASSASTTSTATPAATRPCAPSARRCSKVVRDEDCVARLGGDDFALIVRRRRPRLRPRRRRARPRGDRPHAARGRRLHGLRRLRLLPAAHARART